MRQRDTLSLNLTPYAKINSKWNTEVNAKYMNLKFAEDNTRKSCDLKLGKEFLDMRPNKN